MAKKGKPSGVPVALMFSFGRGCGNPLNCKSKESPYAQVSERLIKLGHPIKDGQGARSHCIEFRNVIQAIAAGFGRKSSHKTKKKSITYQPTEQSVKAFVNKSGINPASDDFLQSFEWRSVRMMALRKYQPVCMCCGASPQTGAVMHVDHIKPRKIFPQLALDVNNLQILCGECNHGKGNWDMTDWRETTADFDREADKAMREMLSP